MCLRGGLYLVHASESPSVLSAMGKMPNFCFLLIFPFPPKILIVNTGPRMWMKDGQILPGILGRGWQLKDALVFGSDSSCGIQFKFTVAGRKSVNAKESKVFVNTLLCEPFKSGLHRLLPSPV